MVLFVTVMMATVTATVAEMEKPYWYEGTLGLVSHSLGFKQSQLAMANYWSVILDFKAKKQYSVIGKRDGALLATFSMSFQCALNNTTFTGSAYFGVGVSGLATTAWRTDAYTL